MRGVTVANPEDAKEVIQAEIRKTDKFRLQHRLHRELLNCVEKTCEEVAVLFGDSLRAVQYWVRRFNEAGVESLRDASRPGRRPRLSQKDKEILKQDLRCSPCELGYSQNLWDGKLLGHHIKEKFGVEIKVRQSQNLFHQLGFRRRKPRPLIAKVDREARQA